ncbi:MAG: DUF4224 domain-containing protein [Nitrococcus sp.]|nr:DUF4224 domain-containing protein [Nitrococcus sp.]
MSVVLTAAEVAALTGYRRPSKQVEQLKRAGIRHIIGADGHPRVARCWLENVTQSGKTRRTEPNWGAFNGTKTHG